MTDAEARARALNPSTSFIVQAPAGAGKTGLLIQRYLVLLAGVEQPESIVAITFTKKAAGEMASRIVEALRKAACEPRPEAPHEALTWDLARAALENDRRRGWNLGENPARLRIRTIDSLCASLSRQMPWLSRFGAPPDVVEDASELYREAARETLKLLESGHPCAPAVERLMVHLDNNVPAIEGLLAGMLPRRDQWLRHVASGAAREDLEAALANLVRDGLARARDAAPAAFVPELLALGRFAAANVGDDHAQAPCIDLQDLPGAEPEDITAWRGLACLLLKADGDVRQRLDVRNGFPRGSNAYKERLQALAQAIENTPFHEALKDVTKLPPAQYGDSQWEALEALLEILPVAAGQLWATFAAGGKVDFVEIGQAAIRALGSDEQPTDLAFAMDCRIQHLLVDEFQDTSYTQFELLERLTAGWTPGDGRTLFLVGDPMQSIYRFREAEVGLFLRAATHGIGQVRLEPLQLKVNFRSDKGIVDWVNATFPEVLPQRDDIATGAVHYAASEAHNPPGEGEAVSVHPFLGEDPDAEARRVVEIVRASEGNTAVLVRARTHLPAILGAFRVAGLRYRAIEIDALSERWVVLDLLALTRALLHPADRVSWLAVLRAPWCGLTLADLEAIVRDDRGGCVHELAAARMDCLGADSRARLARVLPVLAHGLAARRRLPLRVRVEQTWISLGGPACLSDEADFEDARAFFDLLEKHDAAGDLADLEAFGEQVDKLFAQPDVEADDSLQVMSIHKAKGLQFDNVILPGLGRKTRGEDTRLLRWLVRPTRRAESELLLAPVKEAGAQEDAIYKYLTSIEARKTAYETGRLLYVAATRAEKRLHLLGHVGLDKNGVICAPPRNSLLYCLWDAVKNGFTEAQTAIPAGAQPDAADRPAPVLRRLPASWTLPAPPPEVAWSGARAPAADEETREVSYDWAGDTVRHVGTVVHAGLDRIAREGLARWTPDAVRAQRAFFETALRGLGVPASELPGAVEKTEAALVYAVSDPRGRWILGPHSEARNEYGVTGIAGGAVHRTIVDRTFIDGDGVRWIVDYKTGAHEGGGLDTFLEHERERYQEQLEIYAALMAQLDPRPIRLGLYFPLAKGWVTWRPAGSRVVGPVGFEPTTNGL